MPTNTQTIKVEVKAEENVAALDKIVKAITAAGGQATGGGISKTFSGMEEAMSHLKEQAAAQKQIGGKLGGASIRETAGGFEASAKVEDEGQKKAFSPGGMIAGMGTAVGAIGAGFKTLLGMSKIFQTFMGTTGKILGTAVDLMLAPLMPFFMRIMVWLIQKVFPLATKVGNFVGGFSDVGIGAALVGGYVALKFGPTLLSKAGESLGKALVEKMPFDTFGENISYGILKAKDLLKEWGDKVGGFVQKGFEKAIDLAKSTFETIGKWVQAGFKTAIDAASTLFKGIGSLVQAGFKAAIETASAVGGVFAKIGTAIHTGLKLAVEGASKVGGLFAKAGTAIHAGLKLAVQGASAVGGLFAKAGTAIHEGMKLAVQGASAVGGLFAKAGTAIHEGMKLAVQGASAVGGLFAKAGTAIHEGMKLAVQGASAVGGLFAKAGTAIHEGMKLAVQGASAVGGLFAKAGTAIQGGFKLALEGASAVGGLFAKIGGVIQGGFKLAVEGASKVGGLFAKIGGVIQGGFKLALEGASKVGGAFQKVGGAIATGLKSAGGFGASIGNRIATGMKTAPAWMAIGGVVALGIGAVALGAAIGYAMWKSYKEHEAGKDIFKGKDELEIYKMLSSQYGMMPQRAADLSTALSAKEGEQWYDKISKSKDAFGQFVGAMNDIELIAEQFGTDKMTRFHESFKGLEQGEAYFILEQMKDTLDPDKWLDLKREMDKWSEGAGEGRWMGAAIVSAGAEAQGEQQSIGQSYQNLTLSAKAFGGQHMFDPAFIMAEQKRMRAMLNEIYGLDRRDEGSFTGTKMTWGTVLSGIRPFEIGKEDITQQQWEMAFAMMMKKDPDTAMKFLSVEDRERWGLQEFGASESDRIARNQAVNVYIQGASENWNADPIVLKNLFDYLGIVVNGNNGAVFVMPES